MLTSGDLPGGWRAGAGAQPSSAVSALAGAAAAAPGRRLGAVDVDVDGLDAGPVGLGRVGDAAAARAQPVGAVRYRTFPGSFPGLPCRYYRDDLG